MKTLQNNFTTPEQSKRLLELGVPADSADCYYNQFSELRFRCEEDYSYDFFNENFVFVPCWSVGRLMEIFDICCLFDKSEEYPQTTEMTKAAGSIVEYFVKTYKLAKTQNKLDFSKLEE